MKPVSTAGILKHPTPTEKILTISDVAELTTLSKSTIYRMIRSDEFPKSIYISKNRSGFLASEIYNWIQRRPKVSD